MAVPTIDADRLWQAHMEMARIGGTAEGGSNRPALSAEDADARRLLLSWCAPLGLRVEQVAARNVQRWADMLLERPAVLRGCRVNRISGESPSQLDYHNYFREFETKAQDRLAAGG